MTNGMAVSELEAKLLEAQRIADESIKDAKEKEIYEKALYIFNRTPRFSDLSCTERRIKGVTYGGINSRAPNFYIFEDLKICYTPGNGNLQIFKEAKEGTNMGHLYKVKKVSTDLVYDGSPDEIRCHKRPSSCGESEMNWHAVLDQEYQRLHKEEDERANSKEIATLKGQIDHLTQHFS